MSETKKHPILLVDDEPEILYSLKGLLRREFELYTAESGKEALEILKRHAIHVIMTDQRMPEMTGVQLMRRVKNEYPEAIRIVFTGYADIKAVIEAINNGGLYRYITKPWDPDELIEMLHEAAARYDEIFQRNRLLADLREYVVRGQQLVNDLPKLDANAQSTHVELGEFVDTGSQLLERLDDAMEARSKKIEGG
jgi:YesN/AraC family two-component response regulator